MFEVFEDSYLGFVSVLSRICLGFVSDFVFTVFYDRLTGRAIRFKPAELVI